MVMRRSVIEYSGGDVSIEDLIADENVVITISHAGYINQSYRTINARRSWAKVQVQEIKIS
jgi:DNA gyrase/topoisomerase IV subunit A